MAVNAIDFSDLTKKPKIDSKTGLWKEPQPQQNQQNQQIGVKKSDGTVEPAMGYPVNEMGQGDEMLQLFPIPVLICPYPVDYSKELEWIRNCETRKENRGGESGNVTHYNRQSEDTFVLDKPELSNVILFMVVNAIDFSDVTKKPKPQGFQTPPPQPPQTHKWVSKNLMALWNQP